MIDFVGMVDKTIGADSVPFCCMKYQFWLVIFEGGALEIEVFVEVFLA